MRLSKISYLVAFFLLAVCISGCTVVLQKGRRSDVERIKALKQELDDLRNARLLLEKKLSDELAKEQVTVKMEDKGLVITFVAEVLFDSGKAKLREESLPILDKVSRILTTEVAAHNIAIEGHTDNQPIQYSSWKSNWELSAHRALSVLHYLESSGVSPKRLSAIGYGEYKPIVPNDSPQNQQLNRRVEIIIVPIEKKKIKKDMGLDSTAYQEELK